jgi:hypothetical protein
VKSSVSALAGIYRRGDYSFNNRPYYIHSGSVEIYAYYDRDSYWRIGQALGGSQVMAKTHSRVQAGGNLIHAKWKVWNWGLKRWRQDHQFHFVSHYCLNIYIRQ